MRKIKPLISFPFPVITAKEGRWFVIACPVLDIASQGKTEKEAKENMKELINDYLNDPDTSKRFFEDIGEIGFNYLSVPISKELVYGKT